MDRKLLTILLPLMVILTMLASLITPSPVLAAGEPPPPTGEKPSKAPAAAPAKPVTPASPAGASYTAEIPVAAPPGAPDGAANAAAIALSVDAIAQADAVLVGPSGNPLPLAARDTVNVLFASTVYFKGSGGVECVASGLCYYGSIAGALAAFPSRNGVGTIYATGNLVEPGPVNVINTLDTLTKLTGLAWNDYGNYSPRLTGGLLTIANMLKGFTVDGFYISQGIYAHDNAGTLRLQNLWVTNPNGTGIFVNNHKGNIDLFNVTVAGATGTGGDTTTPTFGDGVYLDNCKWNATTSKCDNTDNITIGNSSFNGNKQRGLYVDTSGSALLDRVEVVGNTDWITWEGAYLSVGKGATVKDSRFNGNQWGASGLKIVGAGALNLQNVEAQGNTGDGIYLYVANNISINGALLAGNTSGHGLIASSKGNITLNNITARSNAQGVGLDNCLFVGIPTDKCTGSGTVTVNNSFFISNSAGDGLQVTSKGNVTLNHIYAEGNFGNGVSIDNAIYDAGSHTYKGSGSVSLLNTLGLNQFLGNSNQAFNVITKGAITVKGVYALGNHAGLVLDSCALDQDPLHTTHNCLGKSNISVSAVTVANSWAGNGLVALTGGAISLDGSLFVANVNQVKLINMLVTAGKTVTVTNSSFNNTSGAVSVGLEVASKGNITVNNVQANYNTGKLTYALVGVDISGILLDNCIYNVSACTGSGTVNVSSSLGASKALGDGQGDGLFVLSKGAITVNGFSSTNNGGGAYLDNHFGAAALAVTNSTFSYNPGLQGGLWARSARAITLSGVEASQNGGGRGASVDNGFGPTTTDAITISKSHFDHNKDYGLNVLAKGNLTLNNVSANLNNLVPGSYGADLTSLHGSVTLKDTLGPNQFISNQNTGLAVVANTGAISISGVTALYNSGSGISLNNAAAAVTKTVTAQKILAEHNAVDGLNVRSTANVTLNGVRANFNASGYGVNIDYCLPPEPPCAASGNVSLLSTLGLNSMNNNKYGLWIESAGSVLVNGTTANNNSTAYLGVSGVWIQNYYTPGKTVTVNQGNFNANAGTALYIMSGGVITLNNIGASYNTGPSGDGLFIHNDIVGVTSGINILSTLGNNQFNGNSRWGLWVLSNGNIALNKVIASDNGIGQLTSGAVLRTSLTGSGSVTITCSAFNHNKVYGLEVRMGSGTLTFKSVAANHNDPVLGDFLLPVGKVPVQGWTVCGK
jgi:hypothetical protein